MTQSRQDPSEFLKNLLYSFAAYRKSMDAEAERRRQWEQEQEARYLERQEELEQRLVDMRREIDQLRSQLGDKEQQISELSLRVASLSECTPASRTTGKDVYPTSESVNSREVTLGGRASPADGGQSEFVQGSSTDPTRKRGRSQSMALEENERRKNRAPWDKRPRTILVRLSVPMLHLVLITLA